MRRLLLWIVVLVATVQPVHSADKKCTLQQLAKMPVTMSGTRPIIAGTINGAPARFLLDSGAFFSMLSRESAEKFKLRVGPLSPGFNVTGVGGSAKAMLAKAAEFSLVGLLGGRSYDDVEFLIGADAVLGDIDGIIGQNVIGMVDVEFDLANGFVHLFRAKDCKGAAVAYWGGNASVAEIEIDKISPSSPHLIGGARINGKKIRVLFDTGASLSVLDSKMAAKVGVTPDDDEVVAGGTARGIGRRTTETYIARFDTLDLGGEVIKNARLRVGAISSDTERDMLLGSDFFLSHRVYVSKAQSKLYFTYNGGPVFDLRAPNSGNAQATLASSVASESEPAAAIADVTSVSGAAPSPAAIAEAASLRRRGAASMGRNDLVSAIADFDQAIKLDPTEPENYYQRAGAHGRARQLQPALRDYDQCLKLKPDHVRALIARGGLRLVARDEAGARADFDEATRLDPKDGDTGLRVAVIYSNSNQREEAILRLNAWIDAHPKDARLSTALNERCWSRAILGKELDLAIADCNKALKVGLSNSQVLDSRAFAYLRNGDYDKSIVDYKAVLKLQPKKALSMYGMGIAKIKKGQNSEGEKDLAAAIAIEANVAEFYKRVGLVP